MEWLKKCSAAAVLAAVGLGGVSMGCEEANDAASDATDAVGDAATEAEDGAKSGYGQVVDTAEGVMKDAEKKGQDAMDAVKDAAE